MELPLSTFLIAYLGTFFGFVVESRQTVNSPPPHILHPHHTNTHTHTPLPPIPPPLRLPPPPTRPPPPPPSPFLSSPPPPSGSLGLPQPSPRSPSKKGLQPPPPKNATSKHRNHNHQDSLKNSTPAKTEKQNEGKKIGLTFVGIVAILQVCVVAFLMIRRRQILKAKCEH